MIRIFIVTFFLFFLYGKNFAQSVFVDSTLWSDSVLTAANTAKDISYLTEQERQVIFYMNLARMNGKLFSETVLYNYLKAKDKTQSAGVKSLIVELKKNKAMQPFQPNKELFEEAKKHATDMGKCGKIGHNSCSGDSYDKRTKHLQKNFELSGENCDYGNASGFDIVLSLLIDEGVKNLGHRKNILTGFYNCVGVSLEPHKKYRYNCVQEFGKKR